MKQTEFEALLKIQGRYLLMSELVRTVHMSSQRMYCADVVTANYAVVMDGAVQKSIARYYK